MRPQRLHDFGFGWAKSENDVFHTMQGSTVWAQGGIAGWIRFGRENAQSVDEAVYTGWRLIGYRLRDGRRSRYFCYIAPFEARVTLGFEYGVLLSNDAGLLEGTGTQVRYVTIRELDDIREQELTTLIAEAAAMATTVRRGR